MSYSLVSENLTQETPEVQPKGNIIGRAENKKTDCLIVWGFRLWTYAHSQSVRYNVFSIVDPRP